jgi:excinuclease ABC subunit C
MMFLTTRTEVEALLLEQNLIKQLKPRYNVLMRDDKSFPNILIGKEHAFPQIKKHRGAKKEKGSYFGPFASAGAVNRTLNQLQKVFLLRNCSDPMFESRHGPACSTRSSAVPRPAWARSARWTMPGLVADAELFLQGKTTDGAGRSCRQMAEASEAMEFERAAALRDRIKALTAVQSAQGINPRGVAEADVVAVHLEHGQACVQVFFIRANQSWGNRDFYPRTGAGAEEPEILQAFLTQFYDDKDPPRLILLSHPVEDPDLWPRRCPAGPAARWNWRCRSGAKRRNWWKTPGATRAKAWRGACRKAPRRTSFCRGWPRPSTSMPRRADRGLRQLPISRAPMPWAG